MTETVARAGEKELVHTWFEASLIDQNGKEMWAARIRGFHCLSNNHGDALMFRNADEALALVMLQGRGAFWRKVIRQVYLTQTRREIVIHDG